ncbi:MAG: cellulase family glycosylhydrolase [Planctomycetota bacterium]|nr:cellulase family glycosylhydrolase [Planctomycetota bacterium]
MDTSVLCTVGLLVGALTPLAACAGIARGDVVFQADLEGPDALKSWQNVDGKQARLVPGHGGTQSLLVSCPAETGKKGFNVRLPLPLDTIRGARLRCTALVKAENVAKPPNPWNGIKFMLHVISPAGPQWLQQNNIYGTFDWKPVGFMATVPKDATEAWLILGLEATTGDAWFDDIKVVVAAPPRAKPPAPPPGPPYKGHTLPRLRGAMINTNLSEADLRVLGGEWKANHVRWQLCWNGFPRSPADKGDLDAYDKWLEGVLSHVDKLLPVCEELGVLVLVDLHTPPGGRDDANDCRLFQEKRFQDKFLELWDKIARRYKGNKAVWGYDLVNEPVEGLVAEGLMDWQALAEKTAGLVRAIDPDRAIVIEPAPWGGPDSLGNLEPLSVPGVVYSVHMYAPFQFTHQGVYNNPVGIEYPGEIAGKKWDKEQVRRALKPALDFQRDYGVHMYIGEFSAIRWAPNDGACTYLRDVIDIMEEYGWDWAYHAFREWDGWSVEHGTDKKVNARSPTPTTRQQLLQSWFAKNERTGTRR